MKYNETTKAFLQHAEANGVQAVGRPFACVLSELQAEYQASSESVAADGTVSYNNQFYVAKSDTDGYMVYVIGSRIYEELPERKGILRITKSGKGYSTFV